MKKKRNPQQQKEFERKKCVTLAKRIARMRDGFKCRYCGIGEPQRQTQGSHVYAEGYNKSMSADIDNIIALCAAHHMTGVWNSTRNWNWHGTPAEATDWFKEKFPDLYDTLRKRSQKTVVMTEEDWKKKYQSLKEEEKKYEISH